MVWWVGWVRWVRIFALSQTKGETIGTRSFQFGALAVPAFTGSIATTAARHFG